jgi:small subunit ribosomal protein S3
MSQVSHPYGYRLVTVRPWKSQWFSGKTAEYREFLRLDTMLREYLEKTMRNQYVADIFIERDRTSVKVSILTSRPGLVIGKSGEGIQKLKKNIESFVRKNGFNLSKELKLDIVDVALPEANAKIVSLMIAEQLEKRLPFKRVMKMTAEKVMATKGVKGVRILLGGRLGGSDMARSEEVKLGSIPLQFIRADIDYAIERARMTYGTIGIKVWINKGDTLENSKNKEQSAQ